MAKTVLENYDLIIAEKNSFANLNVYQPNIDSSQTLLSDLKSTSKVARWRLLFWCIATLATALGINFDLVLIEMAAIAARSRYGTLPWYVSVAKEFQYGDALTQINLEFKYAVEDDTKKVVALAAAKEGLGRVILKVATLTGSTPAPLGAPQLAAFTAYMQKKKPAGINLKIINDAPDELQLHLDVNYDPLVLSATGELLISPGTYPVEDAITLYLNSFSSTEGFDGKFELMRVTDYIQSALGQSSSVYITQALSRYGVNPFEEFSQHYYPNAGYMVIDPLTPLNTTITYTANV